MTHSSPHTEAFINEMKEKLEGEQASLRKALESHSRKEHGDFQADHPDYGRSEEENADEVADYIATTATTEAEEVRLKNIVAALVRIESGTYGMTADGQQIPEARLRANPAATTIVT
tara:strand:+ start:37 stop:387 length:351 start_codon:yes stop_codon:yes gene_type:complete